MPGKVAAISANRSHRAFLMDHRAKPGMRVESDDGRLIQTPRSIARILYRPRVGRIPIRRSRKYRGRAGRQGSRAHSSLRKSAQTENARTHGPRRLATSRLVEVSNNSASPPNPRRPARGVYRFAPQRPRWTDRFRRPLLTEARLSTALGPNGCTALLTVPAIVAGGAPRRAAWRAGTRAAWTAGPWASASPPRTSFPGHRSPPHVSRC